MPRGTRTAVSERLTIFEGQAGRLLDRDSLQVRVYAMRCCVALPFDEGVVRCALGRRQLAPRKRDLTAALWR